MRHVKVSWRHESGDEPVLIYSELDKDGWETRKVEVFRDGRSQWCDEGHETDDIGLSEIPWPSDEEIAALSEFGVEDIALHEFERAWKRSRGDG